MTFHNEHIFSRLTGIKKMLMAGYEASNLASSHTKGKERESFINIFLSNVLPPQFRFGSGEVTDLHNQLSGQVDIVMEYSVFPSLQVPTYGIDSRLYIAEGVAAAIEIKSNLSTQWDEVVSTSSKLKKLIRRPSTASGHVPEKIPFFAVGYKGWSTDDPMFERVNSGVVDGILIIETGFFCWNPKIFPAIPQIYGSVKDAWSLWAFVTVLHRLGISLNHSSLDLLFYCVPSYMILARLASKVEHSTNIEVDFFEVTRSPNLAENQKLTEADTEKAYIDLTEEKLIIAVSSDELQDNSRSVKLTDKGIDLLNYIAAPF